MSRGPPVLTYRGAAAQTAPGSAARGRAQARPDVAASKNAFSAMITAAARAYAATGDPLAEEPDCAYEPARVGAAAT